MQQTDQPQPHDQQANSQTQGDQTGQPQTFNASGASDTSSVHTPTGSPGMLGAAGGTPIDSVPQTTAPIGVPTAPGGGTGAHKSAGTSIDPQAMSTASTPSSLDTYGTVGGISRHTTASTEVGTAGIAGTPVPGPMQHDITPPQMPNGERSGARGAAAIEEGLGAGVATGGTPAAYSGEEAGLSGFAHDTSTPVTGPAGANPDGTATPITTSDQGFPAGTLGGPHGDISGGSQLPGGGPADFADQVSRRDQNAHESNYGTSGSPGLGGAAPGNGNATNGQSGELRAYNGPSGDPDNPGAPGRSVGSSGSGGTLGEEMVQAETGSTSDDESKVIRDYTIVTPEVTDMGLDELNRDRPDEPGWGRGGTPAYGGARPTDNSAGTGDSQASPASDDATGRLEAQTGARGQSAQENLTNRATNGGAQTTPAGTLGASETIGPSTITGNDGPGTRAGSGAGMLNTDVPRGMVGIGPLGGAPGRGDTAYAESWRRETGISAPSSPGSRGVHLGIGNNEPSGTSTPEAREELIASEGLAGTGQTSGRQGPPLQENASGMPNASAPEFARHEPGGGNPGGTQALNAGPGPTEDWSDRGDNSTSGKGRPDVEQATQAGQIAEATRSGHGVPLSGSHTSPTPEVGVAGGTGPAQSSGAEASSEASTTPGYPNYNTATGLPAGSGSGDTRPHINLQFDQETMIHE